MINGDAPKFSMHFAAEEFGLAAELGVVGSCRMLGLDQGGNGNRLLK